MDLFYYQDPAGNFGDDLNTWIWDELLPGWREALPGHLLVGVGTLLNARLPRGQPKVVIGTGAGYGDLPPETVRAECRFLSVRGPRSAAALGLPAGAGIVDPAALLPEMPRFRGIAKAGPPVFIPHNRSCHRLDWEAVCAEAGVEYLSPRGDAEAVIRRLASAPLVIAEAMHGAIVSDAFGTPWHGLATSEWFLTAKWLDWADSLGLSPRISKLYALTNLGKRAGRVITRQRAYVDASGEGKWSDLRRRIEAPQAVTMLRRLAGQEGQLSDRARLDTARGRYREVAEGFMHEW